MKVRVNPDLCQGHNRCMSLAPDMFDVDDYGLATALNDGEVPPELVEKARLCMDNCPEFAIEQIED
ncbi:MAG: ferredoxin [Pseudomonadota bacterium]